jgi:transcriptional regulator with XRE-family HTH domain
VPAPKTNTGRDQAIAARARHGQTHDALAAEYGLTRQRVSQIVAAANPQGPEEAQRQAIAERLRSRWDELEKIVRQPPVKTTSIGRTQWDPRTCTCSTGSDTSQPHADDCQVQPVLAMETVVNAIKTQLAIELQYRQMFGVDLATRPGPLLDERQVLMAAEIRVAQMYQATHAPLALPALPANYNALNPEDQAAADMTRRRQAHQAQQAVIAAVTTPQPGDDDITEAEIVG